MILDTLPPPLPAIDRQPAPAPAPPCAPAPDDAPELLGAAPVALLHTGDDGRIRWSNPAALALLGPAAEPGRPLADLWAAGADDGAIATGAGADLPLRRPGAAAAWVEVHGRPAPQGGRMLALVPADRRRAAGAEVDRLAELLDLAREFGRLGVWERNVRTLEGRWDRQVHRFWGIAPDAPTPSFEVAAQRIAESERADFIRFFRNSLHRPGRYSTRYRVRGDDGAMRRIHSQWLVKAGGDGRPERVLGLMMDDSEPFLLARSAGELESQLALAVELGDIAIWRHDLASRRIHFNDQAFRILGLPARAGGMPVGEVEALVHPDDLPRARASAREALEGGRTVDLELRHRRSDGSWRTVMTRHVVQRDGSGRAVVLVGVGLDITGRHSAEQALRSAAERAALAARGAGLATWELDLDSGEVYWDEQMWHLRGHAPRSLPMDAGERLACVHPDDRAAVHSGFHPAVAAGRAHDHQFRVVWPDGRVRWLASRSVELRDDINGTRRRIGVNWDITDSRTAEAVHQERELALRESQAKSRFLARMSHELRTPLNAVLGFAQLLLADEGAADPAAAERRRRLEHIRAAGRHLLGLIDDVLDLTSLEGGEVRIDLQPVALAPLVAETLPLLEPLCAGRRLSLHTGALDLAVRADATRLRQVLLNLLSNAVKYNRAGGEVRVDAYGSGGRVVLRIADTGVGMSRHQLQHLFEPFNRLGAENGRVEGTGIGLTIVKALVERMGGSVQVSSVPGSGSVFELHLQPAAPAGCGAESPSRGAATATATATATECVPPQPPRRSVLYIEDNPVNALIVGELLARRSDIVLHLAADGAGGVDRALALRPDLVLLDMQLPDCDGFEVLRRLRADAATAAIPCIALSANAMPEDVERALRAGVADYWTKPLDFRAFLAALERLLK